MRYTTPQWRPSAAKRRTRLRSAIDVSGFASVMFALLFLMMFSTMANYHPGWSGADLAIVYHSVLVPAALREDALEILITRDGVVYFRDHRILVVNLPEALRAAARNGVEKTVYMKVDARAKYYDVKTVLNQVRQSGLQHITFLAERADPVSTP
jgi:biopolymer transport protein ExbD